VLVEFRLVSSAVEEDKMTERADATSAGNKLRSSDRQNMVTALCMATTFDTGIVTLTPSMPPMILTRVVPVTSDEQPRGSHENPLNDPDQRFVFVYTANVVLAFGNIFQ
jgi:hypothetical protein